MSASTDPTERELSADLGTLGDRFAHARRRATSAARNGREPMTLAQTGGEGEVPGTVSSALGELGWSSQPLATSQQEEAHAGAPESPPLPDAGERAAPVSDSGGWQRTASPALAAADASLTAGGCC